MSEAGTGRTEGDGSPGASVGPAEPCPCGSGAELTSCCLPLLTAERLAATAEELMRSRYAAHVFGHREHLWRTWHPRTRPAQVRLDPNVRWTGLQIHEVHGGRPDDDEGVVVFTATNDDGPLRERSRFARRGGRWLYLDDQG